MFSDGFMVLRYDFAIRVKISSMCGNYIANLRNTWHWQAPGGLPDFLAGGG